MLRSGICVYIKHTQKETYIYTFRANENDLNYDSCCLPLNNHESCSDSSSSNSSRITVTHKHLHTVGNIKIKLNSLDPWLMSTTKNTGRFLTPFLKADKLIYFVVLL